MCAIRVPRSETEAGMTIGRPVRQAENSSRPSSYTIVPRPSTFKQVATEAGPVLGLPTYN